MDGSVPRHLRTGDGRSWSCHLSPHNHPHPLAAVGVLAATRRSLGSIAAVSTRVVRGSLQQYTQQPQHLIRESRGNGSRERVCESQKQPTRVGGRGAVSNREVERLRETTTESEGRGIEARQ